MKATTMETKVENAASENVKEPIRRVLRKAAKRVDEMTAETKDAAAKVETQVRKAADEVKAKGQEIAKDPRAFVETVMSGGKKRAEKARVEFSKEASRIADDVSRRVSGAVENALHRLNVPTHKELQKLTNKVDALNAKIDAMRKAKAARPARPASRPKTAAKKTRSSRSGR